MCMACYKITELLHALSLVDRCVKMRVCKHAVTFQICAYFKYVI